MIENVKTEFVQNFDKSLDIDLGLLPITSRLKKLYSKELSSKSRNTKVDDIILHPGATLEDLVRLLIQKSNGKLDLDKLSEGDNVYQGQNPDGINTSVRSAISKINIVSWHEQVGYSATWVDSNRMSPVMQHDKLGPHFSAIDLMYELKRQKDFKNLGVVYLRLAFQTLYPDRPLPSDAELKRMRTVKGYAGAIYAETRGDVALVNSMNSQNQSISNLNVNYAQGLIQRLGGRWTYYVIGCYLILKEQGINPSTVPYAIISSPILSRTYESRMFAKSSFYSGRVAKFERLTNSNSADPKSPYRPKRADKLDLDISNALYLFQGVSVYDSHSHFALSKANSFSNLL